MKKIFQFKTRGIVNDIVSRLGETLVEMTCEIKTTEQKIKACKMTGSGMIGVILQVVPLGEGDLHLVEVRRGKGDIMEYSKFYRELVDDKLKTMIEEVCDELVGIGGGDYDDE